jgi:hypothetical protein
MMCVPICMLLDNNLNSFAYIVPKYRPVLEPPSILIHGSMYSIERLGPKINLFPHCISMQP